MKPLLNLNFFAKEAILFAATQTLGIFTAANFLNRSMINKSERLSLDFSFADVIILAVLLGLFLFFAKRESKASRIFYKTFLALALFTGTQISVSALLGPLLGITIAVMLTLAFLWRNNLVIHNVIMLSALAGIGAVFGLSLSPATAIIILAVLSIYDIIAVYKTKHMVKLAETMIKNKAIFGFVIPSKIGLFKEKVNNISPGPDFMILGSGDIVLPLVLAASVTPSSLKQAIVIATFSVLGLFVTHIIFSNQKTKKPMAALPPIAASSIIGYLIAVLIFG